MLWNRGAEQLTGIPGEQALGRFCWEIVQGVTPEGKTVCTPECAHAQLLRQGRPAPAQALLVRTSRGRRPVSLSMIAVEDGEKPVFLHLMAPLAEARPETLGNGPRPALSPRQLQVLELLAEGFRAREIAERLGLSETTVRNHIRPILRRLDCHSQLEAVVKARRAGLLS